jgi:lipopolysaccharide export system protein LptC
MAEVLSEPRPAARSQSAPAPPPSARRRTPRRSRFVGAMKLVLPVLAAGLVAIVLAWPGAFNHIKPVALPGDSPASVGGDTAAMLKPRYLGSDGKGRPFTITADAAVQHADDRKSLTLIALQADMTMNDGSWFTLLAETGRYQQKTKRLMLGGAVSLHSDQGYELHATEVAVDLQAGSAVTEKPVRGHGPFGDLTAQRMEIDERGERLRFDRGVHVTLRPAPSN